MRGRRKGLPAAVLTAALFALTACSGSTPGTPAPGPAPTTDTPATTAPAPRAPGDYGVALTEAQRHELALLGTLRSWDPCALVDLTKAAEVANGPDARIMELDTCSITYASPPNTLFAPAWSGSIEVGATNLLRTGASPDTIDGSPVFVQRGIGPRGCIFLLPLDFERSVNVGVLWTGETPPRPSCDVARLFAGVALARMKTPALRTQTHIAPETPFTLADPCAGVPALTRNYAVNLYSETTTPFRCTLRLNGKDAATVLLQVAQDPSVPNPLLPNDVPGTVGKYAGAHDQSEKGCQTRLRVGEPVAGMPPSAGREPHMPVLSSRGPTCAVADEIALVTIAAIRGESPPPAVPATVDPNAEATFFAGLAARKVNYASKDAAIAAAHAVCAKAAAGAAYTEADAEVRKAMPELALDKALAVVTKALEAYCPQDTDRLHQ